MPRLLESIGGTLALALGGALLAVLLALSLVFFALAVTVTVVLHQSAVVLVFAYAVLFMLKAIGTMPGGIDAAPESLVEVSRTLGLSPLETWWKVAAPLALRPGGRWLRRWPCPP